MNIHWAALGIVCVVSLAVGVAIVALVAFALVGLSARATPTAVGTDGHHSATLSAGTGTGIAGACLLAVAVIVAYGLYIIIS
jgi:ABC-type nickel/cobalt efflux system permease component RcnA